MQSFQWYLQLLCRRENEGVYVCIAFVMCAELNPSVVNKRMIADLPWKYLSFPLYQVFSSMTYN